MNRGLLDPASLQQLLYQALDASDNIVLVLQQSDEASVGLVVVATNDAFCRKSGFTTPELIGRPFLSLAAPEASPAVGAAMVASARKQRSYRSELLCGHRNGAPFWLGLHLMPVPESSPPCYVLLGPDITETLRDRKQHSAIQGLLAQVFVSVHAAVAIVDDHGMIVMTNPALDGLLGYRSGGLVGRIALEVAAPEASGNVAAARARQAEDGQTYTIPTALLRADGSQIQVELTSTVVEHEDLKRFRVVTVSPAEPDSAENKLSVRVAGKIRLIGLDEVRTALGARWPAVASRVMASAEHVVRHRCGPRDSWSRTVDGGFLICFGDATEDEAAFRAATIVREIRARLIGEGETPETAYATAITGRVELPDRQDQSPDALTLAIDERLTVRLAEIEGRARKTLQSAIHSASCHLAPVRGGASDRQTGGGQRAADHNQCRFRGVSGPAPHRTLRRGLPEVGPTAAAAADPGACAHAVQRAEKPRSGLRDAAAPVLPRGGIPGGLRGTAARQVLASRRVRRGVAGAGFEWVGGGGFGASG